MHIILRRVPHSVTVAQIEKEVCRLSFGFDHVVTPIADGTFRVEMVGVTNPSTVAASLMYLVKEINITRPQLWDANASPWNPEYQPSTPLCILASYVNPARLVKAQRNRRRFVTDASPKERKRPRFLLHTPDSLTQSGALWLCTWCCSPCAPGAPHKAGILKHRFTRSFVDLCALLQHQHERHLTPKRVQFQTTRHPSAPSIPWSLDVWHPKFVHRQSVRSPVPPGLG